MLARIRKSMRDKDQGFTLIELLVVMIIIGILAAIAIPVFLNQRKKAVDTGIKSDVTNAGKNIASYYVDGTAGTLYAAVSASGTLTISAVSATGSDIASQRLSNSSTALATVSGIGIQNGAGCTPATGWFIGLQNNTAGSSTGAFWYTAQSGLTTTAPVATAACTAS
jgi:type IV pilus assembly protein PilA